MLLSGVTLAAPGLAPTHNFDGDGTPAVWLMNGTNFISTNAAGSSNPGTDWHIIV